MIRSLVASLIILLLPLATATAQTAGAPPQATIPNPLRAAQPAASSAATPTAQATTAQTAAAPEAAKPKRERSAKQKQGDNDMKTCGASWKADKDALKAKGQTWRTYLKECRGVLKAARG